MAVEPSALRPWYMGSNGATNFTRSEAQKFARELLDSEDYRSSLRERVKNRTLPAPIEALLWHYAYGKPIEQVNLNVSSSEDLSALSVEELLARANELKTVLEEATQLNDAIPAQYRVQ